ncbi:hypothetical protein FB99_24070 [Pantoea agglomerans]|nr:hypothetical protein FB99_24070 [Pantoea agglomerans]
MISVVASTAARSHESTASRRAQNASTNCKRICCKPKRIPRHQALTLLKFFGPPILTLQQQRQPVRPLIT